MNDYKYKIGDLVSTGCGNIYKIETQGTNHHGNIYCMRVIATSTGSFKYTVGELFIVPEKTIFSVETHIERLLGDLKRTQDAISFYKMYSKK